MHRSNGLCAVAVGLFVVAPASAAEQYVNNFEADTSASWTIDKSPATTDEAHNFFFDYSTVGIPAAPSGAGTRGMKLQANLSSGVFGGMSVSPTGLNVQGDQLITFDWWANINGPFPVGGSGSTNLSTFGIGTAGAAAQWPGAGPELDSVMFAATGDGNSSADYRAYSSAATTGYIDGDPEYEAATRNASDPYYAGFGSVTAPAAQIGLYPQQTGVTLKGAAGMEWHQVEIQRLGDQITWKIDGLLIATVDTDTVTLGGGNIFFGHSDVNATSSTDVNDADLLFTLIDNVRVVDGVPAPGVVSALGLAGVAVARRKR